MKRKILSLILVFAMTVSLLTVGTGAVEPTYGDTAGHWAESSIERWSGHGIIQGSNGLFDPNGQLTCAQLATILAKLLKLPAAKDAGFTDNTADAWYYDAINRCAAAGILNGNGDGTVTPDAPISRERAIVMLGRALGIEPIRKPDLTKYTDAAQVSAYAQGYVAALIEAGIVGGVTADELAPQDNITRAATVTILDRAIGTYADKAGATVKADGKGIVLVVAENVKITGAPEGTKIVVADGATGLTVNGKAVSDDQTYIVPKTEPAKPSSGSSGGGYSHSHSYVYTDNGDGTHTATCYAGDATFTEQHRIVDGKCTVCGAAQTDKSVASVKKSDGTYAYYATLAAALAAAKDGDTVKLLKDITLTETWTPIGTEDAPFKGTFDGQGYTIIDLKIDSGDYAGLIGVLDAGTVKNVKFASVNISTTGTDVGAAVGRIINNGKVENVQVLFGSVSGAKRVGGVVGCIKAYGSVADCSNAATVSATTYNVGGIVGAAYYTETGKAMQISGCTNTGAVTSAGVGAGGIVGLSAAHVTGCENSAAVTGTGSIGGIVGEQKSYGSVTNCTNSAAVTNNSTNPTTSYGTGGIIGWLRYHGTGEASDYEVSAIISVTGNSNSGSVNGGNDAGGIIGACYNSAVVTENANTAGSLSATTFAAGIVGNYQTTETPAAEEPASNKLTFDFEGNTSSTAINSITAQNKDLLIYTNGNVVNGEIRYTLAEFNALTSIPAAAEKVYVNLGNASLQNGLTIGNDKIADHYYYGEPNSTTAPEGFPHDTGRTDNDNRHIYSTGKDTVTVVVTGSVTGASDTGDFNAGAITLKVPDAANVIFDTVTFGEGQMAMSMWTESHVQSMTVSHRLASVTFNGCTFKGNWLQNGAFGADEMTITGCTFEKYENTAGINSAGFDCKNNSNPIWIQNMGQTNVTIEGCTIDAVRPIKLWEGGANGSVTIRGNTFNMEKCSIDDDNTHKNIAIMFCGTTAQVKLGNVEISGNTVTGDATSLICFYNGRNAGENHYPAMNGDATFSLYDNILPAGTALSVIWKTATVWAPTYVPIPQ